MAMPAWLSRIGRLLGDLVYVPHCAVCDMRLPPAGEQPLCALCNERYQNDKQATCPVCATTLSTCLCPPAHLPRCGVHRMVKLFHYRPASGDASAMMLYKLKHRRLSAVQQFFGRELAEPLRPLVEDPSKWIVTFSPRSRSALRRDGFDHAAALAAAVAGELGCRCVPTIMRLAKEDAEQKTRSRTARFAAARQTYSLRPDASLAGKRVILVDDIMTTGATLSTCARLLRRQGRAGEVVLAVLAVTPHRAAPT